MRRGSYKNAWTLFLFLLAGIIIGGVVGNILAQYFDAQIFKESIQIGTKGDPLSVDLGVVHLVLGLTFTINFGTVLGVLLGLFFFFRS